MHTTEVNNLISDLITCAHKIFITNNENESDLSKYIERRGDHIIS
jgi:hypothetical protein